VWNRPLEFKSRHERNNKALAIEEKYSYMWLEVSNNTKSALKDVVKGMVIVQDREGDIYEQFALIPDEQTDLLIRARVNWTLKDKTKLFSYLSDQPAQGNYENVVEGNAGRQKRTVRIEIRYKKVGLLKTDTINGVAPSVGFI
jgi:hypothetical protein